MANYSMGLGGDATGAGAAAWSSLHMPQWQKDALKTTRIYVVVYPSDGQSRTFNPENFSHTLQGHEIKSLGYGIYVEPAKESGAKKLFKSGSKVEARLFTFEGDGSGQLDVKVRNGDGVGVHGMLVRFMVAQHRQVKDMGEMMGQIHAVMDSAVLGQKDRGISGLRTVLEMLQQNLIIGHWDLDEFIRTMDTVVEEQKKEGTKVGRVTTINWYAHVSGQK